MTLEERFWAKVDKRASDECWPWLGAKSTCTPGFQYGSIGEGHAYKHRVHRLSYELANGPLADDKQIHHVCRNTLCVNPAHLMAVTSPEHRRLTPNQWKDKTHCFRGHPLSGDNLAENDRRRRCRACTRLRTANNRGRRRAIARMERNLSAWIEQRGAVA